MNLLYAIIEKQVLCLKDANFVITNVIHGNVSSARSIETNRHPLTRIKNQIICIESKNQIICRCVCDDDDYLKSVLFWVTSYLFWTEVEIN